MPRFSRNSVKSKYFHVMTQGINKSYIFNDEQNIKYYIKLMYELKKDYFIKIISYCIMNNHAHILMQIKEIKDMSKYMHRLNCIYAKYYNKKYNRVGYVFRDRYKAEAIHNEEHFYNCIKYIYDNPVKAGICNKAEEYPYSNYKHINIENVNKYAFIDIEEELERNYKDYIKEFLKNKNLNLLNLKENNQEIRILICNLKKKYGISLRKIAEEIGIPRETLRRIYNEK